MRYESPTAGTTGASRGARSAHVVVIANEKGGSGKTTTAMHVVVALLKAGQKVASIDVDSRQRSLTRYVANRRLWTRKCGVPLELPDHHAVDRADGRNLDENEAAEFAAFGGKTTTWPLADEARKRLLPSGKSALRSLWIDVIFHTASCSMGVRPPSRIMRTISCALPSE